MLCEGDEMLIVAYWAALPVGPCRLGPVQPEERADPIQEANRLRVEVPVQYCQPNSLKAQVTPFHFLALRHTKQSFTGRSKNRSNTRQVTRQAAGCLQWLIN
jgi:hypothetical protein